MRLAPWCGEFARRSVWPMQAQPGPGRKAFALTFAGNAGDFGVGRSRPAPLAGSSSPAAASLPVLTRDRARCAGDHLPSASDDINGARNVQRPDGTAFPRGTVKLAQPMTAAEIATALTTTHREPTPDREESSPAHADIAPGAVQIPPRQRTRPCSAMTEMGLRTSNGSIPCIFGRLCAMILHRTVWGECGP